MAMKFSVCNILFLDLVVKFLKALDNIILCVNYRNYAEAKVQPGFEGFKERSAASL